MIIRYVTDIGETKRTALTYLLSIFCNEQTRLPEGDFARFFARVASTEDLVAALELAKADINDCERWGLSPDQWRAGIKQALYLHIVEAMHSECADGDYVMKWNAAVRGKGGQC